MFLFDLSIAERAQMVSILKITQLILNTYMVIVKLSYLKFFNLFLEVSLIFFLLICIGCIVELKCKQII